jgi:hypothetical protein
MKRVLITALALIWFSAAGFAQTAPAQKRNESSKIQVAKKTTDKKMATKMVPMNKVTKPGVPAATKNPVAAKPVVTKPVTVAKTNTSLLKKDGTPDKRYAANKHLKKDGTKDLRYKENKLNH